ncbi:DUF7552 domain-containing protein [Halococcus thailandensis]|uniref:DUF7552 domain-containing protein n=1 Tax=Halococcus thailandensis JCM 13552 TaxID=1227457 RepID=M0MY43_9EURY|nr:hypothetical protein [Halococcus thailandensis]EMA50243.1 hypothetical protein C451_17130 [Halococcus thailandensis JCM 13552]
MVDTTVAVPACSGTGTAASTLVRDGALTDCASRIGADSATSGSKTTSEDTTIADSRLALRTTRNQPSMTEPTLDDLRTRIDFLATDVGRYTIVCARTGARPVPIAGRQFPDREAATRAARAAQRYRARLRRYDSRVAYHDLIVRETMATGEERNTCASTSRDWQYRFWALADRELARLRAAHEGEP